MNHASQNGAAKTRVSVMLSLGNSRDGTNATVRMFSLSLFLHCYNLSRIIIHAVLQFDNSAKVIIIIEIRFQYRFHIYEE